MCKCFYHFDVVTLIEVIEHLYPKDLENLVENVFNSLRPRLIIVTTPNADFNILFTQMKYGKFRHLDHKFEFTRQEFQTWAQTIALNYNYLVEFNGVGEAPLNEQHRNVGTCTQIAIFHRQDKDNQLNLTSNEFFQRLSYCKQHETIGYIDYPYGIEKTMKLHEQIQYILQMYRLMAEDKARHGDDNHDTLPLTINYDSLINHPRLKDFQITIEELKHIIQKLGYKILDNDHIILSDNSSTSVYDYDNDDDENEHELCTVNNQNIINDKHHIEESWD